MRREQSLVTIRVAKLYADRWWWTERSDAKLGGFGWRGSYATKDEAKKAAQRVFPTATFIEQDELP